VNHWLQHFNRLPKPAAIEQLLACCSSRAWANGVAGARPFDDADALMRTAERVWWSLPPTEWLLAFAAHPRIGEGAGSRPQHGAGDRWSQQEQAGAASASERTKAHLADVNREYEARFGYTYIVCATGKSAEEMLALALERLEHDAGSELRVAAAEQAKITALRLQRLLQSDGLERSA
jgi:OHCU decarboxylase